MLHLHITSVIRVFTRGDKGCNRIFETGWYVLKTGHGALSKYLI